MVDDQGNASESRVPKLDSSGFDCPRCGVFAMQSWDELSRQGWSNYFDDSVSTTGRWRVAQCARCKEWSVWRQGRMVYPVSGMAPVPHSDMPEDAKALYEEAREVLGISRRAGTALARASLERLLKTLDPQTGNPDLATRIAKIAPRLPESLGQILTIIRVAGNQSLHVPDQPGELLVLVLDPEETEVVDLMFEAINELVEQLITRPAKVASHFEKVPEMVRARYEAELRKEKPQD